MIVAVQRAVLAIRHAGCSGFKQGRIALRDEAALREPVLARAGSPCMLVGHSYGAAIALITALLAPERISALVLYEPTLFALLDAERPAPAEPTAFARPSRDRATRSRRTTPLPRRATSSLLDGRRRLGSHPRRTPASDCRVGDQRAALGSRTAV